MHALCLLLVAAPVLAQQVSVNYNHSVSFSQYHTYAWGGNNTNADSELHSGSGGPAGHRNAMAAKGLQKVQESQNPDLILTASGGEREQTSYNAWGMRGIGGGMGGITPQQNVEATMVVSLYDAKAQELVWRGIAQDTLEQQRQQEPGDGAEGRPEDVQAVAEELTRTVASAVSFATRIGHLSSRDE